MSEQRLIISSSVIERLNKIQDLCNGKLYGIRGDGTLSILGFCVTSINNQGGEDKNVNDIAYSHDLLPNLPANVNVLGVFNVGPAADLSKTENKCLKTQSKLTPVTLSIDSDTKAVVAKLWNEEKYETATFEIVKDSYWEKFLTLKLNANLVFMGCYCDLETLKDIFLLLRKKIERGLLFLLKETDVCIMQNNISGSGITDKSNVQDLKSIISSSNEKNVPENNNVMNFDMCFNNSSNNLGSESSLLIKCERIHIDGLSFIEPKTKVSKLYEILVESYSRGVTLTEDCVVKQFTNRNKISMPEIYHFLPQKCGHYVSIAYPKGQMEDELITTREIFHKVLSLPMDTPIFRRGNVHSFETNENPSKLLINPHEGLNRSGVVDGEVSLVQGKYAYHHYMQDGFDDSGWGCAYRSLQTIFSWFRLQGFTGRPIPTHEEIQKCLVLIGDKPSSFIGSKNWIGSTEVSFVLETLLGVNSRIVSVSSGEELSMKGGELGHHFKTQGTPIMIGGGVLAHTILGVDYNRKTGSLKFLILDPHYTGDEDLSTIQAKGWCGWKGIDFWKKNAFYNMCLPLRPKSI